MRILMMAGVLAAGLIGCGDSGPGETSTNAPAATDDQTTAADRAQAAADAQKQQELSRRLMALDFFSERMWPGSAGDAGVDWLKNSAAGSGLELTRVMPEVVIERDGVAVRPVTVQAEGDWNDVVAWLQAIEASQRRLVLRDVELHSLRNRVVADLKIAVMIDRPTGLDELARLDVASLRGEALDDAVGLIETELAGKSKAMTQLGADASWSTPIAELTALLPQRARPVNLSVGRKANDGQRAQDFSGTFTLLVADAGQVPGYVRQLQKRDGFTTAGLKSLRRAGADWQRVTVTFTFAGPAASEPVGERGLAEAEPAQ